MNELIPKPNRGDIAALQQQAGNALTQMQHTINLFDTHNTDAQEVMQANTEYTPARKLRHIAAQLQSRQAALVESGGKIKKKRALANEKHERARQSTGAERARLLADAEAIEDSIAMTERPYRGALQAVLRLQRLHDQVYAELKTKYGEITPEVIEREEARYWIMRIFAHVLRDLRSLGHVHDGRQSVLYRMGFDPGTVERMLRDWLRERAENPDLTSKPEEDFLRGCADKFEALVKPRLDHVEHPE
jgi:hypothetical protein